jgi:hypothetical protein
MLRRLTIVSLLCTQPLTRQQLINAVRRQLGDAAYGTDSAQALRRDLHAITADFACELREDADGRLRLTDLGLLAVTTLSNADLHTFAGLQRLFPPPAAPTDADPSHLLFDQRVGRLLEQLLRHLPPAARSTVDGSRPSLRIAGLSARSYRPELAQLINRLERECRRHRISFDYRSLHVDAQKHVRHTVDPYEILFREDRFYLNAFMLENSLDRRFQRQWTEYRVDRIVPTITVHQIAVPLDRPPRPTQTVVYRLDPSVARRADFTILISGPAQIEQHTDGSATVTVETTDDLWQVCRQMLRYGRHCRVLAPAALVSDIREHLAALAEAYRLPE